MTVRDDPLLDASELTIPDTLLVPLLDAAAAVLREASTRSTSRLCCGPWPASGSRA